MSLDLSAVLKAFSQGKPIILMDKFDRENEADLIFPAELITPATMNFIIRNTSGIVCLTLTPERAQTLGIHPMLAADQQNNRFQTPFGISIEAKEGVTTGVSAQDRTTTILTAMRPHAKPSDLARPGHVFPLIAHPEGLRGRQGHTEASVDLMKRCGYAPAAVLSELMNLDGSMSRLPDAERFSASHGLPLLSIEALLSFTHPSA